MNTVTKSLGIFILAITVCVIWSWPKDKEMTGKEVVQEVATVATNVTEAAIETGSQVVKKGLQPTDHVTTSQTPTSVASVTEKQEVSELIKAETGRPVRFKTKTTLPFDDKTSSTTERPDFSTSDEDLFADRAFSGKPVQLEPSNVEYRAAQKRLNENIISLEKVVAEFN